MTAVDFLAFTRGPLFDVALIIFIAGLAIRFVEILVLGRRRDFSEPRRGGFGSGLRTMFSRTLPETGTMKRAPTTVVAGWVFHIGFLVTLLLFVPHIEMFQAVLGFGWPGLPTPIIDFAGILAMVAMVVVLINRLRNPVMRFLSGFGDYLPWLLTFLPLITGWLVFHRLLLPYPAMLGLHILSVELLMILFPFTKLMHTFTAFLARYYTGAAFGRKGVQS